MQKMKARNTDAVKWRFSKRSKKNPAPTASCWSVHLEPTKLAGFYVESLVMLSFAPTKTGWVVFYHYHRVSDEVVISYFICIYGAHAVIFSRSASLTKRACLHECPRGFVPWDTTKMKGHHYARRNHHQTETRPRLPPCHCQAGKSNRQLEQDTLGQPLRRRPRRQL